MDLHPIDILTAFPDDTLDDALRHFGSLDVGRIPVVDRRHPRRFVGMLRRGDIAHACSHALMDKHWREDHLERLRLEAVTGTELVEMDLTYGDAAISKLLQSLALANPDAVKSLRRTLTKGDQKEAAN